MLLKEIQNLNFLLRYAKNELSILKKEKSCTFKVVTQKLRRTQHYRKEKIAEAKYLTMNILRFILMLNLNIIYILKVD